MTDYDTSILVILPEFSAFYDADEEGYGNLIDSFLEHFNYCHLYGEGFDRLVRGIEKHNPYGRYKILEMENGMKVVFSKLLDNQIGDDK